MGRFAETSFTPIIKRIPGAVQGALGNGANVVVKIPPGAQYDALVLECTIASVGATRAQLEAQISTIRFTVSGIEKWTLSAIDLIAISEFYKSGVIGDTGLLVIPFSRLWMDGVGPQLEPAYGTVGEQSMQLEVQFAGSGVSINAMEAHARMESRATELGKHVRISRFSPTFGSTGKYYFTELPHLPGEVLYALHMKVPVVANLTNIALVADENRVIDDKPSVLNQLALLSTPSRTPQTAKGYVHLDLAARNIDQDAMPCTMDNLILELDFANAAPNGFTIIAEYGTQQASRLARAS